MANPEGRHWGTQVFCEIAGCSVALGAGQLRPAGAFIPTTTPPPLDSELDLRLRSPLGEARIRVLVVQVITDEEAQAGRVPGCGVLFLDLEDDQRAFIGLTLDALQRAERAVAARARRTPSAPRARPGTTSPRRDAEVPPRPRLSEEGVRVLRQLESALSKLPIRAPLAVLGLEPDAGADAAREAYLAMCKRYHPHVYARFDNPEINRLATELFIAHKHAYTTIATSLPAAPRATQARRTPPETVPLGVPVALLDGAAPSFSGAAQETTRGSMRDSLDASVEQAHVQAGGRQVRRAAADIALRAALKYLAGAHFDEAERELERLCALRPDHRESQVWLHVCRARRQTAARRPEAAREHYRAVLALDPHHREASEHLARGGRARVSLRDRLPAGDKD